MTREEFQTERTRIISEMLDNPDEYGIYPTTKCFEQLDALFDSLSLPPAEGAEKPNAMKFLSDNGYGSGFNYTTNQVAYLMQEFAAQQQPTAEGAEENVIYHNLTQPFRQILQSVALHGYDVVFAERDCVKCATDFATLHAQQIADRMVSERQYDVDFGGHLKAGIKVTSSGIEIIGAVNGWGNAVPDGDIIITNIP